MALKILLQIYNNKFAEVAIKNRFKIIGAYEFFHEKAGYIIKIRIFVDFTDKKKTIDIIEYKKISLHFTNFFIYDI